MIISKQKLLQLSDTFAFIKEKDTCMESTQCFGILVEMGEVLFLGHVRWGGFWRCMVETQLIIQIGTWCYSEGHCAPW